jgi:hypothetical protein
MVLRSQQELKMKMPRITKLICAVGAIAFAVLIALLSNAHAVTEEPNGGEPEINVHNCLTALRDAQRHNNVWQDPELSMTACKDMFIEMQIKLQKEQDELYERLLERRFK